MTDSILLENDSVVKQNIFCASLSPKTMFEESAKLTESEIFYKPSSPVNHFLFFSKVGDRGKAQWQT
jgi:hypothetical protein